MKKKILHWAAIIVIFVLSICYCYCRENEVNFIDAINRLLSYIPFEQPARIQNDYLNRSIEPAIDGNIDTLDIKSLTLVNGIYTNNNDSFNACASNMVLGIMSYRNAVQDSALLYLLTAEQYSDSRPELKPHIYYYLASTFMEFDPILAHDIISSHPEECIDRYDYSRFKNVSVSQQEMDAHNVNSIYYSRLLQRSLDAQEEQHQKEIRLYWGITISVAVFIVLVSLSIFLIIRYRQKNKDLTETIANKKAKFDTLLERYMDLYRIKCDESTVVRDANEILSALSKEFPLSSSDIAIIWLILLSFDKKMICSTLNITGDYYSQRRSKIRKALNFESTKSLDNDLKAFVPEFLFNWNS